MSLLCLGAADCYLVRHLNHTLLTLDGNFHATRYKKNSLNDYSSLFAGRAYYPLDSEFNTYLRSLPAQDIDDVRVSFRLDHSALKLCLI